MLRRAAAVAADAGIRACAAVEGKRTAQATKQPLLQQQLAGSATEAHSEGAEQGEEEEGGGGGNKGRQQRQRKVQPHGSRGLEGRRKDPVKVAAALLSRQRVVSEGARSGLACPAAVWQMRECLTAPGVVQRRWRMQGALCFSGGPLPLIVLHALGSLCR
jgi:hypothetical protein